MAIDMESKESCCRIDIPKNRMVNWMGRDESWIIWGYRDYEWLILLNNGEWLVTDWWFGTWLLWISINWECHDPNWRTHIFQRGRYTTNQNLLLQIGISTDHLSFFCRVFKIGNVTLDVSTINHSRASYVHELSITRSHVNPHPLVVKSPWYEWSYVSDKIIVD